MSDQKGMYAASVPAAEIQRLARFNYPNEVSRRVLDELQFESLIDAGAGSGTAMAEYVVNQRHAAYTAFDHNPLMVERLSRDLKEKKVPARVFCADILDIPDSVGRADVAHARFLLMHIPGEDDREQALCQMFEMSARYALLLEYNWRTLGAFFVPEVDEFKRLSLELMEALHVDPYAGETMEALVRDVAAEDRLQVRHDQRPSADSSELIPLCTVQAEYATQASMAELSEKFLDLGARLVGMKFEFVPPEITVAIIGG